MGCQSTSRKARLQGQAGLKLAQAGNGGTAGGGAFSFHDGDCCGFELLIRSAASIPVLADSGRLRVLRDMWTSLLQLSYRIAGDSHDTAIQAPNEADSYWGFSIRTRGSSYGQLEKQSRSR